MTLPLRGRFDIGPSNGRLRIRTWRQGLAARAGHDLVLEAAQWHGHVEVPADASGPASIEVEVDLRRIRVVEGTGGVKPLSEADKADIHRTMQRSLSADAHPVARFTSSEVKADGDQATVTGELSIAGQSHPLRLDVHRAADGTLSASGRVVQSAWGIKPYTGFLGALELRDAVDVDVELQLPG